MNELDSKANTRAIDSLLNYETVKYFGNEEFEARRYDESMQRWEQAAVKSQTSLSLLNVAQSAIIADRRDADHVARDGRRGRRHDDDRRPRARQRVHDPDLHPAQLPRRPLPRDQAGARRHGADVRAHRREHRGRRRAGRAGAATSAPARSASSTSTSATSANRQILFDVSFTIPAGKTVAVVGPVGRRQEHAVAPAVPLLRRDRRAHHGQRAGHPRRAAGQPARGDRHRAAGHGAVQRHDRVQHRATAAPARRTTRSSPRRSSRRSTTSSRARPRATRRRSASAASSSPAARSSASRSRARCSRIRGS